MFINSELIVNKEVYIQIKSLVTCCICDGIVINPKACKTCLNIFCGACIDLFISENQSCPFDCKFLEFFNPKSKSIKNNLDKLIFLCKCNQKFNYNDFINHSFSCNDEEVECIECNNLTKKRLVNKRLNFIEEIKQKLQNTQIQLVQLNDLCNEMKSNNEKLQNQKEKILNQNLSLKSRKDRYLKMIADTKIELSDFIASLNKQEKDHLISAIDNKNLFTPDLEANINDNENTEQNKKSIEREVNLQIGFLIGNVMNLYQKNECEHFVFNHIPFFSCCRKIYPCYICHNNAEDHESETAVFYYCLECQNLTAITRSITNCQICGIKNSCLKI